MAKTSRIQIGATILAGVVGVSVCVGIGIFIYENNKSAYEKKYSDNELYSPSISKYMYDTEKSKKYNQWISSRSLSLKFMSKNLYNNGYFNTYGTAWIMGKSKTQANTYYLGTNLHVASTVQNSNLNINTVEYNEPVKGIGSWDKVTPSSSALLGMDIGIAAKTNANNEIISPSTETHKKVINNDGTIDGNLVYLGKSIYTSQTSANTMIKPENIKVAWSGAQAFEKFANKVDDPIKLRGQKLMNPTIDFAILKVDFSSIFELNDNNANVRGFKNFFQYYDSNPTKFSKTLTTFENTKSVYLGGFPAAVGNGNDIYPRWVGLSNVPINRRFGSTTGTIPYSGGYYPALPYTQPLPSEYNSYAVEQEITFKYKNYDSYRNVATQLAMPNIDLKGGSSGSMVINEQMEVIGIYWGGVQYKNVTDFEGRFDLFYSMGLNGTTSTTPVIDNKGFFEYDLVTEIEKIMI